MQKKDYPKAKFFLDGLVIVGGDGYDARFGLGKIAVAKNDAVEAEKQLQLAKKMDPERADPYVELAKLWLKTREDDALKELEAAARLDCMDASIPKLLVEKLHDKGRWAKLAEVAPLALYTDPFDAKVHARLARALVELGRHDEALREVDAAEQCKPDEKTAADLRTIEQRAGRI
jgi:tetratricopeptide (TPR) repeat protein